MREVEIKFLDMDHADLMERLEDAGAERVFEGEIRAEYFDDDNRRLSKHDRTLRLRRKGDSIELTLKERKQQKKAKVCTEYEIIVSSMGEARAILHALGFRKKHEVIKHRISYLLGEVHFELDRVAGVPPFVEIEGSSLKDVHHAAKILNLPLDRAKPWSTREVEEYYRKKRLRDVE